jgi:hypothetical protein
MCGRLSKHAQSFRHRVCHQPCGLDHMFRSWHILRTILVSSKHVSRIARRYQITIGTGTLPTPPSPHDTPRSFRVIRSRSIVFARCQKRITAVEEI